MCLLYRKRKSKKRQWFPIDEDVQEMEMQVLQQESMDLQVVEHDPMEVLWVVDEVMEEVHIAEQVVDEATEEVHVEEHVVEVKSTKKKCQSCYLQETYPPPPPPTPKSI
jgi:hypothetical protein